MSKISSLSDVGMQGETKTALVYSDVSETMRLASYISIKEKDIVVTYRGFLPSPVSRTFKYEYDGNDGQDGINGPAHARLKAPNGRPVRYIHAYTRTYIHACIIHTHKHMYIYI